jgi:glycosyltransferase involved in cell wall biosynthesis
MKILHLVGFYPEIGGPFAATKELLIKLYEKGISVKVLSPIPKNYDKEKLNFIKDLPFEVEYIEEQLPRFIIPSFSLRFISRIKELHRSYDLLHLAGIFDFYSIPVVSMDLKFIYSSRGTFMKEAYKMRKFKKLKKDFYMSIVGKKILKKAKRIHLLTQEEKEHFLEFYPEFEYKIRVIPNGLDLSLFKANFNKSDLIKKYPHLKDKKIILFLSRINWKKGLDILIPAFAKLHNEDKKYHLLIVGKDDGDSFEKRVRQWVNEYGLTDAVTFTGLLTGKDKLIAFYGSDVFVLPSYSENFGVAVVEAMACGVPIVVSDKVGISKEIMQYNAGTIVKTNVEDVYNGIRNVFQNLDKAKDMALNAKIMVHNLYDINKVADEMIKMYEEAIDSR